MNLLITPAFRLTQQQRELEKNHALFFLEDERIPLKDQSLTFDPQVIEGIVCNFFFLHNPLSALPNLRLIQLTSAGMDRVPLEEIKRKGIDLRNAGSAYAIPMAEFAVCKILELCKCSGAFLRNQEKHVWQKERGLLELAGRTALILGFGNVGRNIAKRLKAFDVTIHAVDLFEGQSELVDSFFSVSRLKEALQKADILVITLPLTPQTYHILNAEMLACIKPGALLINVARGPLVDTDALFNMLASGYLAGAALDVFEEEPLSADHPLWELPNVLVTPHNSFIGEHNHNRLFQIICRTVTENR